MFDKNFYPTTRNIYDMFNINCHGMVVLEPQAGKGDMIEYLKADGAKRVIACELNSDLAMIAKQKADQFLKPNFFDVTSLEIGHVNIIVMNPPFDRAVDHILHAWEIAPDGCVIYSLLNDSNIGSTISVKRSKLAQIAYQYGKTTYLGDVFRDAERKTGVEVSMIVLEKPDREENTEFSDFFTDAEDEAFGSDKDGLIPFNDVRSIVQRYIKGCEDYKELMRIGDVMFGNLSPIGISKNIKVQIEYGNDITDYEGFKKELQKKAWEHVFKTFNMEKFISSGVKKDLNKFIEENKKMPFTMKNIYSLMEVLLQTRGQLMERAIVEAVDTFTQHTDENRHFVEGWKTNSGHMINQKFIIGYLVRKAYSGDSLRIESGYSYSNDERLKDLIKAICFITGRDYNNYLNCLEKASAPKPLTYASGMKKENGEIDIYTPEKPYYLPNGANEFKANVWYDVEDLFEIKVYKKGSAHIKFKDLKAWEMLNRTYAKIKGQVLPEKI